MDFGEVSFPVENMANIADRPYQPPVDRRSGAFLGADPTPDRGSPLILNYGPQILSLKLELKPSV
jgi:hypothetical protein